MECNGNLICTNESVESIADPGPSNANPTHATNPDIIECATTNRYFPNHPFRTESAKTVKLTKAQRKQQRLLLRSDRILQKLRRKNSTSGLGISEDFLNTTEDNERLEKGLIHGQPVCLDLEGSQNLDGKDCIILADHLDQCWLTLRRAKNPPSVTLAALDKETHLWKECTRNGHAFQDYKWKIDKSPVESVYEDKNKYSNIIYLCSSAEDSLLNYDLKPTDVLVIGGFADKTFRERNKQSLVNPICKRIPVNEIMTIRSRIPVKEIVTNAGGKKSSNIILTSLQMFETLVWYLSNERNWAAALYCSIPRRYGLVIKDSFVGMLPGEPPWVTYTHATIAPPTENPRKGTKRQWVAGETGDGDFIALSNKQSTSSLEPLPKLRKSEGTPGSRYFPSKRRVHAPHAGFTRKEWRKRGTPAEAYVSAHKNTAVLLPSPSAGLIGAPRPRGPAPSFTPLRMYAPCDPGQARFWRTYQLSQQWVQKHVKALEKVKGANFPFPPPPNLDLPPPPRFLSVPRPAPAEETSDEEEEDEELGEVDEGTQVSDDDLLSPTPMTEEMIEFFKKTIKHREERDSKKKLEEASKKVDTGWFFDKEGDYVGADKVDALGKKFATTSFPTVLQEKEKRAALAKELYGDDAQKIIAAETLMQMQFDNEIDETKPPVWPVIPFKL